MVVIGLVVAAYVRGCLRAGRFLTFDMMFCLSG